MPAEATWRLLRLESRVLSIMQKFQLNGCQDGSGEAKPTLEIGQVRNWLNNRLKIQHVAKRGCPIPARSLLVGIRTSASFFPE